MMFRVGFLVAASVAASVAVSHHINTNSLKKQNSSIKHSEKNGPSFKQSEEEEEKFTDNFSDQKMEEVKKVNRKKKDIKTNLPRKKGSEKFEFIQYEELKNVTEMELVKELEQRKVTLEGKFAELYALKEQQSYVARLRRHLEDKMTEIDVLNVTINSLQAERKSLKEEIKQVILAKKQLEMAKKMIEKMQMKMDVDASQMKGQLMILEEQVSGFQGDETSITDATVEKKLKGVRDVETEAVGMRRRNKELELEKRELAVKLVAAQTKITALSNMTESKIIAKVKEEISTSRCANEDLSKEVDRLQQNRFNMVEELVYQRWLHTCLQFEAQNYQTPPRKASNCDIDENSSQKSQEKTKQPTLDPSFDSISSHTSSTESDETDSTTNESSSSSQRSSSKKYSLTHRIKRWGRSKYDSSAISSPDKSSKGSPLSSTGLIRRFSTSMIASKPSMLAKKVQNSTESPGTPSFPRVRRVSFNDSVITFTSTNQDAPPKVVRILDKKETVAVRTNHRSTMNASPDCETIFTGEKNESSSLEVTMAKAGYSSDASETPIIKDSVNFQVDSRIDNANVEELHSRILNVLPTEDKVDTHMVHLIAAFFFFLFMLALVFLVLTTGIY